MAKVAVNGITGHVGYTIAKQLKEQGFELRGIMRNVSRVQENALLKDLDIEIVEADMRDQVAMERALKNVEGFFQVAAVFDLTAKNPEESVIRPNISGTEATLTAAAKAGVSKVVYTSSIAAVGTVAPGEAAKSEADWNLISREPYALSKALSEKRAYELSESLGINLVSVLPGTILGPGFSQATDSIALLYTILANKVPAAMPVEFSYVDVRDVAAAHIGVYKMQNAKGRYIATNETWSFLRLLEEVLALRPAVKTSTMVLPIWIARIFPAIEAVRSALTRTKPSMNAATAREYLGRAQKYESSRLKDEVSWQPRSIRESLGDTLAWIDELKQRSVRG